MAKQINARIKIKHDVDSNWIKAVNFIPAEGELIVYEADNIKKDSEVPRLKVGDGVNKINNLPFITDPYVLKVNGKQLSTNDFTNNYKEILDRILTLGDDAAFTDTTYSAAVGLNLLGTTFYNTGILSLEYNQSENFLEFSAYNINNNSIETRTINLNSLISNTLNNIQNSNTPFIKTGNENGTILVNNQTVSIYGLGSLAYKDENFIYDIIQGGSGEKEITIGTVPDGGTKIHIDPTTSTWNYLYENKYITTYSGLIINNSDEKPWEIVALRPPSEEQLVLKTGIFSNGIEIPENSDLNSFTTSGLYISKNNTVSATLINAPLKTLGFKLIVLDGYTSTIKNQLIITGSSSIFYRVYVSGSWTEWLDLTKNQEEYLPLTGGTLTGQLVIEPAGSTHPLRLKTSSIDVSNFDSNVGQYAIQIRDDNESIVGYNYVSKNTAGYVEYRHGAYLSAAYNDTGANKNTYLYARVNKDGSVQTGTNSVFYGAVWNDYAEFRKANSTEPGRCVQDWKEGKMIITKERLLPACKIISDTYGFAIGETKICKTPVAVAGRVLAYPYEDIEKFEIGDAVCSGPNGTISRMSREEIINYPDRIIGIVSEIPSYKTWGEKDIQVDGRIWIYVR